MLKPEERESLVKYRLEKSAQTMVEAEASAKLGFWSLVAQRLYYAAYYAVTAKLVEKQMPLTKTHAGVMAMMNLHLVKNGTFPHEQARVYQKLFNMRQTGDYDDYFDHKEEDVLPFIAMTKELIEEVGKV